MGQDGYLSEWLPQIHLQKGTLMHADLLIKHGHIYDPGAGIDHYGDIAVAAGKILSIDGGPDFQADQVIDAAGCLVLPGLIDIHTHVSRFATHIGLNPDIACIPNGVTAVVDCGSSGVSNFRAVLRILRDFEIRSRLVLHVSAGGQMMSTQFAENTDPSVWNRRYFEDAFRENPEELVGLKIRASRGVLGAYGMEPVRQAVRLAEHLGTRLFVHATDCLCTMEELAGMLRPGDVLCHIYHGDGNTLLREGPVAEGIWEARRRGVILDVAQGQGNFSIPLAAECIRQGLFPDTISTDLNIPNWDSPLVFSLLMTMSKFLALGLPLEEVIRSVTCRPAAVMGMGGGLGTLREGTAADISVVQLVEKPTRFRDKYGNQITAQKKFMPLATVIGGRMQYQSSDTIYWEEPVV